MRLYHHPSAAALARALASRVAAIELIERSEPPCDASAPVLWATSDHVALLAPSHGPGGPVAMWVSLDEVRRRADQGGALLRACGVRAGHAPTVLDAMAGTGVDGLVLALRGSAVTLVERQPLVSILQQDLVRRVGADGVTCLLGDGFELLQGPGRFDVIYLDPMFPARGKAALPGKRMQVLALLAEPDPRPLQEWITEAVRRARLRVVVKRRRKDPVVLRPDWQIRGRTVRFDVYGAVPAAPQSGSPGR
jgi:16S rRNA (guanine1516-N2)-methyltransferase